MKPEVCKQCGSEDLRYLGLDDGGGDYGDAITEDYKCEECGYIVEVVLMTYLDDDEEFGAMLDYGLLS